MPVSGDVVTLSFSLAVNNTPTGFWGNLIQFTNANQGFTTTIVGVLTVSVLMFQLWIMCRQTKISKMQTRISEKQARISNRSNEISRKANEISMKVGLLPIRMDLAWKIIADINNLKYYLQELDNGKNWQSGSISEVDNLSKSILEFYSKLKLANNIYGENFKEIYNKWMYKEGEFYYLASLVAEINDITVRYNAIDSYPLNTKKEKLKYLNKKDQKMIKGIEKLIKELEEEPSKVLSSIPIRI